MIRWRLSKRLKAKGWTNAHQLSLGAGIGYPAATQILRHVETDAPIGRLDTRTLEKLRVALGVKGSALALLEWSEH